MSLSREQVENLLGLVSSVESDELDCDGCFDRIAEFADLHLSQRELPEAMQAVDTHLQECLCCKDEFNALLKGLRELEGNPSPHT